MRDQAEPICDGPGKTNPCLTTNSENDKIVIAALKESGNNFIAADVMELADMQDLGSCAARRAGSSPVIRITGFKQFIYKGLELFLILDLSLEQSEK